MDQKVYAEVPNYFDLTTTTTNIPAGSSIREVLKGIPGMPQCSRLFSLKAKGIFTKNGLKQSKVDTSLYYDVATKLYLIVWVDDLFLFFPKSSTDAAKKLWTGLQTDLDLDEWDEINDCLGCNIHRDRVKRTMHIEQTKAIKALAEKSGLANAKAMTTPMTQGLKLSKEDCPTAEERIALTGDQKWYQSAVASCIYFSTWSRPDITYAVGKLCKFMHNPGKKHITALKHLIRYLNSTAELGLVYKADAKAAFNKIYGYYDASHADCIDTSRSTMAFLFYVFGGPSPIAWNSKLHSFVTTSSNHSEYCASAKSTRQAKALDSLCNEVGFNKLIRPIHMFSDSQGAIAMAYNPVARTKCKHVDLADHYTREQVEEGVVSISYEKTENMRADALTKPLGNTAFLKHRLHLVDTLASGA